MNPELNGRPLRESHLALLLSAAELAREHAYAPYTRRGAGAAVMSVRGTMYAGCSVENASPGLSVCAERTAVFAAVAAGERAIQGLAIVSDAPEPPLPCGACCQVLHEFAASVDMPVIIATSDGARRSSTLAELFPRPLIR